MFTEEEMNDLFAGDETISNIEAQLENLKPASAINHPPHYNREGGMECIDEMIIMFGIDAVMDFCKCNAWKYRYRAADKNGEEDLKKSDWYIKKYQELHDLKYKSSQKYLTKTCGQE